MSLRSVWNGLLQLIYPRLCTACVRPLLESERILCLECQPLLPQTNYHHIAANETALRLSGRIDFRHATSFAYFVKDGLLQHLLHELKYKSKKNIGYYLGTQLGRALLQTDWGAKITLIVPVPLHPKKEQLRGGNQCYWIAKGIASVIQVSIAPQALKRVKNTDSQTHASREQRLDNIRSAFVLGDGAILSGQHILLVDDVLTTGATLEACAEALMAVPNLSLSIATIAIASA